MCFDDMGMNYQKFKNKDNTRGAPSFDFIEAAAVKTILCRYMPVQMLVSSLRCLCWFCIIKISNLLLTIFFPSSSALHVCNWSCRNKISAAEITDFTSRYQLPLEGATTWRLLKIFIFHASSISSLHERWTSGWICRSHSIPVDRAAFCLCLWQFFSLFFGYTSHAGCSFNAVHEVEEVKKA